MSKTEQPPAGEFTKKVREDWDKNIFGGVIFDLCDIIDRSEARYEDVTGGMMKKQVELIQEIATSEASRKELLTACEDGLKDLGRLMMRLDTSEVDSTIRKMQAAIAKEKEVKK